MDNDSIAVKFVVAKPNAALSRKTSTDSDPKVAAVKPNPANTSASNTASNANSTRPGRQSSRLQNVAPESVTNLDPDSKLGRQLVSKLVKDPVALRKKKDEIIAKQNFVPGDSGSGWFTMDEPEDIPEEYGADVNTQAAKEVAKAVTETACRGDMKTCKKRKSREGQDAAGPSTPAKQPRKGGPAKEKAKSGKQRGEPPPDDDNNDGDDDPDDDGGEVFVTQPRRRPINADEKFLHDAIDQLSAQKSRARKLRRKHIREILPLLEQVEQPIEDRIQRFANVPAEETDDQPDCYIMDAAEAKRFLESNAEIDAPVFVPNGAREGLFTSSTARPIEQVLLTWLLDGEEKLTVVDSNEHEDSKDQNTVNDFRDHFLRNWIPPEQSEYPWNLPDIMNPRAEQCVPPFVQSLNCNLLRDLMRRVLDASDREICPGICKRGDGRIGCQKHKLTRKEFHNLQDGWDNWQGTIMLADPGAITLSHWDRWGMGTWISCHEGQIGLIWRSYPDEVYIRRHLYEEKDSHLDGRSLYKILRPGEAVYMPPGTIHTVFRRPNGNQTLAFAGHVHRRSAMAQWLWVLKLHFSPSPNSSSSHLYSS